MGRGRESVPVLVGGYSPREVPGLCHFYMPPYPARAGQERSAL